MNNHDNRIGAENSWRRSLAFGIVLLIAVLSGWAISSGSWLILLWIVPLLVILPGILRAHLYTYRCASLVLIAYMLLGWVEIFVMNDQRFWAVSVLFISSMIFFAVLGYVRARRQH